MKYSQIRPDASKYPEKGYLLAYTRARVIFTRYENTGQLEALLGQQDILELHLFDRKREYRLIASESRRYQTKGYVETVADFAEKEDEVYRQETMLDIKDKNFNKLYVLNHVHYDDVGMAAVDNYRMYVEEG